MRSLRTRNTANIHFENRLSSKSVRQIKNRKWRGGVTPIGAATGVNMQSSSQGTLEGSIKQSSSDNKTSVMQGIFGASLTSQCIEHRVLLI